jgi:hypothetical protein
MDLGHGHTCTSDIQHTHIHSTVSTLAACYNYRTRSTLSCAGTQCFPANERRAGRVKNMTAVVQSCSQDPIGACQLGSGGLGWSGWSGGGGGLGGEAAKDFSWCLIAANGNLAADLS